MKQLLTLDETVAYLLSQFPGNLKLAAPPNIQVYEFYFLAGQFLKSAQAQQNYISLNYTRAARGLQERGLQVIVQLGL